MKRKKQQLIYFTLKHIKYKWKSIILLCITLMLMLFFSFSQIEYLQNNNYIYVAKTNKNIIKESDVQAVRRLDGVEFVASVGVDFDNETVLFTANKDLAILAKRYARAGYLPSTSSEVDLLTSGDSELEIGDNVRFKTRNYLVVGIVDDSLLPFFSSYKTNFKLHLLTITNTGEEIENIMYLIVGVTIFHNSTIIAEELKSILGENSTFVIQRDVDRIDLTFSLIAILVAIVVTIAISFLFIIDERSDGAIFLAVGWTERDVLKVFYPEFLIMLGAGIASQFILMYLYLTYILKYFLFLNSLVIQAIITICILNIISFYLFAKFFLFKNKNIVEVLIE